MVDTNGNAKEVKDQAQEAAQKAQAELKEVGRELRKQAEGARKEVVKQLHKAADTIRKEARDRGASDEVLANADGLATGLEKAANYLNNRDLDQMSEEAARTVRANPLRSVGIAFGIGVVFGLLLRRE